MLVYAPQKVSGIYASVRFVDGVGETDDAYLLSWFKQHGYTMKPSKQKLAETVVKTKVEGELPDFESMSPVELKEWASLNGVFLPARANKKAAIIEKIKESIE